MAAQRVGTGPVSAIARLLIISFLSAVSCLLSLITRIVMAPLFLAIAFVAALIKMVEPAPGGDDAADGTD